MIFKSMPNDEQKQISMNSKNKKTQEIKIFNLKDKKMNSSNDRKSIQVCYIRSGYKLNSIIVATNCEDMIESVKNKIIEFESIDQDESIMKRLDMIIEDDFIDQSAQRDLNNLLSKAKKNGLCDESYRFCFFEQTMIGKGGFCFDVADIEDNFGSGLSDEDSNEHSDSDEEMSDEEDD